MPHIACHLAMGIVDHATAEKLRQALALVPPSYLFYAAVGLLFLGLILRARGTSTYAWGGSLALSALTGVLWGAAVLVALFLHRTHEERKGVAPVAAVTQTASAPGEPAPDGPCRTKTDCGKAQVCAKVGADSRCRTVCAKSKPCGSGFSCVLPESGPTVCFPDTAIQH